MNVVFDLGAVLIGWEPARLVQAHFPDRAPTEAAATALARALFHHEDWLDFDRGIREAGDVVARAAWRLGLPAERLAALILPLGEQFEPIAEGVAVLQSLHARRQAGEALRLFYLSNMPAPYARALQRRHAFFRCFDGGIFSADVKRIKPHEEIFQLLAWQHGLEPEATLFIDDSVPNIETARALGWHAIHCASPAALGPQVLRHVGAG